ncbi:MAG: DUF4097 family beta strand repeat-containing protein [Chloroflexi bacterium]|nr:DUF4097 family beta strand repeat-containing protein [Chloroflexota bacterium]
MASFRQELPAGGATKIDVELWRGNIVVRSAPPGEPGALESDWELDVKTDGGAVRARQPLDVKRPLGLADLIGEQQVRIEIESVVLLDKQIRHGGGDVVIALPSSVGEVRLRTARGDIYLQGIGATSEAYTGRGNVVLSGGRGLAAVGTGVGDVKASNWQGPLRVRTGKGNLELREIQGDLEAKTGKGEVRIEGAGTRADIHTGHGNLVASRLRGNASLSTGHGDLVAIDLDGARLEGFTGHGNVTVGGSLTGAKVKTGHGEVTCRLGGAEGDCEIQTGRGNIILDLESNVTARIDASTRHGGIDSNLPLVKVGTSGPEGIFGQRLVGTATGTGPVAKIALTTRAGDIRIFRRADRPASGAPVPGGEQVEMKPDLQSDGAEPMTAGPAPVPDEDVAHSPDTTPTDVDAATAANSQADQPRSFELEILGAVSRGDLSVDEAMVLLETARSDTGSETWLAR